MAEFLDPLKKKRYGLIGKRLGYSVSPDIFARIFDEEGLSDSHTYERWVLANEQAVADFLEDKQFDGCNVTIPYKTVAAMACDELRDYALNTGVINTIKRVGDRLVGYNTDVYGVLKTFGIIASGLTNDDEIKVLILGTGGASKAVACACLERRWQYTLLSRTDQAGAISYEAFHQTDNLESYDVIVNTTPLGMVGSEDEMPQIRVDQIVPRHFIFDVIYSPPKTRFMIEAERRGARAINGRLMLEEQARKAWEIWGKKT